ncbi:DUF262 domain-containing protein [Escherichia coli]|nr:DUF262 domain-containing protein [Escherichia coli]
MKSETLTVQQLFQDRRQYCVPFYQRAYVWTQQDQWSALLEDILRKHNPGSRVQNQLPISLVRLYWNLNQKRIIRCRFHTYY